MKVSRSVLIAVIVALFGAALAYHSTAQAPAASALAPSDGHGSPEPPMLGVHYARGEHAGNAGSGGTTSPLLTYHSGYLVTTTAEVSPIYWGSSWATYSGDKVTGLKAFYEGANGAPYMGTNTEYTNTSGFQVTSAVTYLGEKTDASAAPRNAPRTSAVLAEVAKLNPSPTPYAYYPVYSDQRRGSANYCAWHSWGTINGVLVQFGFFFNLDGDAGCDPKDNLTGHSQGLAALANVSGHELSEMVTDPRGTGWYDAKGAENSDKCAWTFGSPTLLFSNSTQWKVQGNWSNAAYATSSGYDHGGCIDHRP